MDTRDAHERRPGAHEPLTDQPTRQRVLLVLAIVLTGFSMRTAVTSVGAVLVDLQRGLHASGLAAGWITTLPVLCFAAVGATGPWLIRRLGTGRTLVGAMCCACLGLAVRSLATNVWTFAAASVLALAGGAISNVSMPTLVKRHFPDRIASMTAAYTTALALGATAASGLTVPIGALGGIAGGILLLRTGEHAFRTLLLPHIDKAAMERIRQVEWVRPDDGRP